MPRITDFDLLEFEPEVSEQILKSLLIRSRIMTQRKLQLFNPEDFDDEQDTFNIDLSDSVMDILIAGMMLEWINPQVLNTEKMKNILNTKDMHQFSPAQLQMSLQSLRNTIKKEFEASIIDYTYEHADIENIK